VLCVQQAVMPGPLEASGQPNPLGIDSARVALEWIFGLVSLCFVVLMLLCAGSVVVRFRRASGVERQQLKWFAYGAGQLAVLFALSLSGLWNRWISPPVSDLVFGISFALIPVAIGIAILRYRLYDIDRLIRRTLVYGLGYEAPLSLTLPIGCYIRISTQEGRTYLGLVTSQEVGILPGPEFGIKLDADQGSGVL
jgi:hypothetical protein